MPRVQVPLKKANARVVGVEDRFLRFARIGAHEQHPAVAEPDVRHLHHRRRAAQHDDLVAPVKLIRLARRKAQRHIGFRRCCALASDARPGRSVERHRNFPDNQPGADLRRSGSASAVPAAPFAHSPAITPRVGRAMDQPSATAASPAHSETPSPQSPSSGRITLRTTFRDTRSSRQITLIGFSWTKNARRIFALVSTTSIPTSAPMSLMEANVNPPFRGSRLDADHPENGVLIPCRFTPEPPPRSTPCCPPSSTAPLRAN